MTETRKRLLHDYHHIDNGGVTTTLDVDFHDDDSYVNSHLRFEASFLGYTTHTFEVHNVSPKMLRELGAKMIVAAEKLEQAIEE